MRFMIETQKIHIDNTSDDNNSPDTARVGVLLIILKTSLDERIRLFTRVL